MTRTHPDVARDLALAILASSAAPALLLDGELTVISGSTSFYRAFGLEPPNVAGQPLFKLGAGEWDVPQLRSLLSATLSGHARIEAYEMDLKGYVSSRRLVLNAQKLDYGDTEQVRLLLTISDVTEARISEKLKDDLLREKAILLQELQHRVANSLQIIASVLMQSARRVQSEEARGHLHDAHNRVMSIATLQQQLAASRLGDVELRGYFIQLCESLGASMIHDHDQMSIMVTADGSSVKADISVSLGLIVTELVINALKHAFPRGRSGRILVDYHAHESDWTLSVSDNGVGTPETVADAKPGLGTSIVEALANQLDATVETEGGCPGTTVSITHAKARTS
ncbi:sensor histidine kinase [Sphingomonas oligoaromativorans]|uniref:sensor histidine kinase n=1 Tax=Sphingomonas oligoaromativorans TaxID=575322 RepID=UPI00141F161C|nr:sensor histidine kinase [Sphingomonas oligoaromativorans]NIJ34058.1 two-component sensor histidine kinase [Sphingomonas oligoaromativorans]